jgi:hypothetical protein
MEGAIKWRAVVPLVRGHRGAAPASCAGLQSRQFLADAGEPEAIKDWSLARLKEKLIKIGAKGGEPRPLRRIPKS